MLESKYPTQLEYGKYLNNFTHHKSQPSLSMTRDSRFKLPRNASEPGPGHYRVDRDFLENELTEFSPKCSTNMTVQPSYSMGHDERCTADGTLKGLLRPNAITLGPGEYNQHKKMNVISQQKNVGRWTIPKAKESAEALRERKKKSDVPGPGVYGVVRCFDDGGREKLKAMERAARRGTNCWAASQYSHIFLTLKPRKGASLTALPGSRT